MFRLGHSQIDHLVQVIEPIGPVCHFYKLVSMGSHADATTIVNHMETQFKADKIWSILETRLKAFTSDGANVSLLLLTLFHNLQIY